jgi:hypothetical protein
MNLQSKLDLIEQYGTCTRFLSHPGRGIDYKVSLVLGKDTTAVHIEVYHETTERANR